MPLNKASKRVLSLLDDVDLKAGLEEEIKLDVPGKDVHERTLNPARATLQTANIRFDKKEVNAGHFLVVLSAMLAMIGGQFSY